MTSRRSSSSFLTLSTCNLQTQNLITDRCVGGFPLTSRTVLIFTNVVYFNVKWAQPFTEMVEEKYDDDDEKGVVSVEMMFADKLVKFWTLHTERNKLCVRALLLCLSVAFCVTPF